MAMGLPVIVSDIPPLIEVTGNGEYALSFRAQDAEDLAQKLLSLINNPAARAQLGAKARAWASQQFGIDAYIARLIILYNEMIRAT
jgi:glycosyltransferase involved in cell wall biosynthesis